MGLGFQLLAVLLLSCVTDMCPPWLRHTNPLSHQTAVCWYVPPRPTAVSPWYCHVIAVDVILMPRAFSSSIQSDVADLPLARAFTSPASWMAPANSSSSSSRLMAPSWHLFVQLAAEVSLLCVGTGMKHLTGQAVRAVLGSATYHHSQAVRAALLLVVPNHLCVGQLLSAPVYCCCTAMSCSRCRELVQWAGVMHMLLCCCCGVWLSGRTSI